MDPLRFTIRCYLDPPLQLHVRDVKITTPCSAWVSPVGPAALAVSQAVLLDPYSNENCLWPLGPSPNRWLKSPVYKAE